MATARQVAIVRTIFGLAAITNNVHVRRFDPLRCEVEVDDPQKLMGRFIDIGIQEQQMQTFRQILSTLCPEIRNDILSPTLFPLSAEMQIALVVSALEGLLVTFPNFLGVCFSN